MSQIPKIHTVPVFDGQDNFKQRDIITVDMILLANGKVFQYYQTSINYDKFEGSGHYELFKFISFGYMYKLTSTGHELCILF